MTEKIGMIKSIYKTLLLFEDISDINSEVTEGDYRSDLNRMFVLFSGKNNEICEYLSGSINLGGIFRKIIKNDLVGNFGKIDCLYIEE